MKLHVIDGTFELFRAFHSRAPEYAGPDGVPAKATVGVIRSLLSLLHDPDEAVTHVAVAFDNPIESFRNDLFDGYKTGAGIDPDLLANFDPVEEAVGAIGVTVWSMDRWEADDALATAAERWADDVEQVRIMSVDKDLSQCVRGDSVVLVDRIRDRVFDENAVVEKFGVAPTSMPDYLALVGDSADGIPGLPGWGAKSSSTVLREYGSLDAIPDGPDEWTVKVRGAKRLADTLRERREDALLYRKLARLVADVPLEESLDDLEWAGVPRAEFEAWCDRFGLERLAGRPDRWA
jgi:5'-3' exonuclease